MRTAIWMLAPTAIVGVLLITSARDAAATSEEGPRSAARFAKIDRALFDSSAPQGKFVPASLSDQPIDLVLELAGDPVAVHSGKAKNRGSRLTPAEKDAIRQQLRAQQDGLHGPLAAAGAKIVGQMQDAYNGIHVVAPQKSVPELAGLPGVVALHGVRKFNPVNVNGVPFVGAPQAWGNFGRTGAGVKVAIIDTGVDYTHKDFGGAGTVDAFNRARAASTLPADPAQFGPGAPKVKGGFDFAGDDYNANVAGSVPRPDPNPLDCNGHGTHTAGTAAGFGVLSNGTNPTTYDATTVSSNSWNVGPGTAPRADIYAYRVFGCAGSSSIVDLAINQAVADDVDVISMSLGSDFGETNDATSVAAQNAFEAGIAVIASAGNAGGNAYIVGSPSTSNGVLSVAAMDGTVPTFPGANLTLTKSAANGGGSAGPVVQAINANNAALPSTTPPPTVKVLRNSDGTISLGCNEAEYAGTAGMVVVTQRGTCARVARAVFGDKAGAAAVVMINNAGGFPPFEGQITENPDTGEKHTVTIPFLGVQNSAAVVSTLLAADGGSLTLATATTVANANFKVVAGFSSGGPRNPDSAPKPDVIAPGVSVASAGIGSGNRPLVLSGTSMACPMTSGIAALVKEAHPSWNGAQIKAAIMNTADAALNVGYNSRRAGAGVVQAQKAVNSAVLATTADNLDALAFGHVAGAGAFSATKAVMLTNNGSASATYNLAVSANGNQLGAVVSISPASVTVPMGQTVTVQVSVSMSAAAFAALPSDDTFVVGPGGVLTARGNIVATPAAGSSSDVQTLRVPYMFVPRGLSNVAAGNPSAFAKAPGAKGGKVFTATLPVTNSGIHAGTADVYSWGITDPNEGGQPMDVRNVGVQVLPGSALGGADTDRSLVFVINTWGRATNQSVNEFDIPLDINGDGVADFFVVGVDLGAVLTGSFDGRMGSFTINAATGDIIDAFFADAPMNGSIVELPALASELGLSATSNGTAGPARPEFTYAVNAFSIVPGTFVDRTGAARFNAFTPPVSSGDFASLASGASATIPLAVDKDQQKKTPALGWLVISVDDASGAAQADSVPAPQ